MRERTSGCLCRLSSGDGTVAVPPPSSWLRCLASSATEQPVGATGYLRAAASTRELLATSSSTASTCHSVVDKDHPDCVVVCREVTSFWKDGALVDKTSKTTKKPC